MDGKITRAKDFKYKEINLSDNWDRVGTIQRLARLLRHEIRAVQEEFHIISSGVHGA